MVYYSIYHKILETVIPKIKVIALKMEPSKDAQVGLSVAIPRIWTVSSLMEMILFLWLVLIVQFRFSRVAKMAPCIPVPNLGTKGQIKCFVDKNISELFTVKCDIFGQDVI